MLGERGLMDVISVILCLCQVTVEANLGRAAWRHTPALAFELTPLTGL
jgi:hypothetical protein